MAKYARQTINKNFNLFDITIFEDEDALHSLAFNLLCDTKEEAIFKAKIIFDEIKKGKYFYHIRKRRNKNYIQNCNRIRPENGTAL